MSVTRDAGLGRLPVMTMTFDADVLDPQLERSLAAQIEAGVLAEDALTSGLLGEAERDDLLALQHLGEAAQEHFVHANLRLVVLVTGRYGARLSLDADDLFQDGVLGLLEALRRFDYRRGVRFATFALPWIRMRVSEYAATQGGAIELPARRAKRWVLLQIASRDLQWELGRPATYVEIAERLGESLAVVRSLARFQPPTTLDPDAAPPAPRPDPGDALWDRRAQRLLAALPRPEFEVVARVYGVAGYPMLQHAQIADELGLSLSTVRRRVQSGLQRLRAGSWVPEAA